MNTEIYIPWNEWGRDAIFIEMPASDRPIHVQGVHVIEAEERRVPGGDTVHMGLRIFDFGKWGCSTLCDEGGETVRTARYRGGRESLLEGSGTRSIPEFDSLGDGIFYAVVGHFCHWKRGVG